jgi:hypothetical protein
MRRNTWWTVLLIVALAASAAMAEEKAPAAKGPASPLDRFTPEQRAKLQAGEAVFEHVEEKGKDGQTGGHAQSSILINAPIETCWKILLDYEKQQEYIPRKTVSKIVKQEGKIAYVEKEFDFYVTKVRYTMKYTLDEANHRLNFEIAPEYPHDLKDSAGYYGFEKVSDKATLLTYVVLKVDTGVKVPQMVQEYLTSRDLPAVVVNIKKRVESGGTWTKKE